MSIYWRQWCSCRAQDQHRLGVAALEADDVVGALLHLRAAVRLDCQIQVRAATASVYERGARLWYSNAEVRDEIRRREDLARRPETQPTKPLFFVRPKNAAAVDAMVESMADVIIDQANAWRLANGLPPLEND